MDYEPMESEESNTISQNTENYFFDSISFHELLSINAVDYEAMSNAAKHLTAIMRMEKFYSNCNNCVDQTVEFIFGNVTFLTKNNNDSFLVVFLKLLTIITENVPILDKFKFDILQHEDRITNKLTDILQNDHLHCAHLETGRILTNLIKIERFDIANIPTAYLISMVFDCFVKENSLIDLYGFLGAIFKKYTTDHERMQPVINWLAVNCKSHIEKVNDANVMIEIVKCFLNYYTICNDNCSQRQEITHQLTEFLPVFCNMRHDEVVRDLLDQLMIILVENMYFVGTFSNCEKKHLLLGQIKWLDEDCKHWPTSNSTLFFIFAFLQLSYSKCLWNGQEIIEAIEDYMSENPILEEIVLKALVFVYPVIIGQKNEDDTIYLGDKLLESLTYSRNFDELLLYNPNQIKWILESEKKFLKTRFLYRWLLYEKNDEYIVCLLNQFNLGIHLINFLILNQNCPSTSRVSSLVCKLKTDRFMEKTLLNNLPRLYFKSLVFTTNIYEKLSCFDHKEMEKSFIIVGSYLPCLESNLEVEKGCIFLSAALSILQNTPKVLGLLSYLSGIVKYIAKFCCLEPDEVATAAIKLLKTIILIEETRCSKVTEKCDLISPIKLLREDPNRQEEGLQLLYVIFRNKNQVIVHCPEKFFMGLFHFLHDLIIHKSNLKIIFKTLEKLILLQNNLALSTVTCHVLPYIYLDRMDPKTTHALTSFVNTWTKNIPKYLQRRIPRMMVDKIFNDYQKMKGKIEPTERANESMIRARK